MPPPPPPPLHSTPHLHFDDGRRNRIPLKFALDLRRNPIPPPPPRLLLLLLLLRRRRYRTVPSVSAGRRLHFSGLEHERRTRSIRNEGHQFNVTDAFSGKERERWRCCDVDAKGANYIREVQEKESGGKHVSVHTGPGRSWHSTFPRRRQQYHYHR